MTTEQEQKLAKDYFFECVEDNNRGDNWCKFKKDNKYVWSIGYSWVKAEIIDNSYTNHKKFNTLQEALSYGDY